MNAKRNGRIGVNIASMLPWSAVPLIGLWIAKWISKKAGFAFWQVLPLRSVSASGLRKVRVPIKYIEPAWNATTLLGHLNGELGSEHMPTMWQDVLFFPSPSKCEGIVQEVVLAFEGVHEISHNLSRSGVLVEFHPNLGVSAKDLALSLNEVVLDTKHIRQDVGGNLRPASDYLEDWTRLFPVTRVIHVQAWDEEELEWILAGYTKSALEVLLNYALRHGFEGDFVVEYRPGAIGGIVEILFPWILAKSLRRVRERVEEIIG
ncbi:MAG: hypothetical protein ABIB98_03590 [bacterium]